MAKIANVFIYPLLWSIGQFKKFDEKITFDLLDRSLVSTTNSGLSKDP